MKKRRITVRIPVTSYELAILQMVISHFPFPVTTEQPANSQPSNYLPLPLISIYDTKESKRMKGKKYLLPLDPSFLQEIKKKKLKHKILIKSTKGTRKR